MTRYHGPRLRIIRRLGELPGFTQKTTQRENPPGQHTSSKSKSSQYGLRLQEKQKLRFHYGLNERQLMNYVKEARATKGSTGQILLELLEMRLDNLVFRLGLAPTIIAARQFVTHGHIKVNNKKVDFPAYACKPSDIISVKDRKSSYNLIKANMENELSKKREGAPHLLLNAENLIGLIQNKVPTDSIGLKINELLIVEYYSRKL